MNIILAHANLFTALQLFAGLGSLGHGPPEKYREILNTGRTYIKFRIVAPEVEQPDDEPKRKKSIDFDLSAYWYEKVLIGEARYLLKPELDYWTGSGQKVSIHEYSGKKYVRFYEGCDYRMPAPVGKRTFEFVFFNHLGKRSQKSSQLFHKYNFPPNHSLRLNIVRWVPPYRDPNLWVNRTFKHHDPEYEIIATVEPNPDPDEDKPCDIPKD